MRTIKHIRFSVTRPHCDRVHYLTEKDVLTLLSRLPEDTYACLRVVHFNDRSWGVRFLGRVSNESKRELAIHALPPRVSLTRFLARNQCPEQFGARRGAQWPHLAVRRFLLYDVFLHELGHLQVVDEHRKSKRLRYAREKKAQEFADHWRKKLWSAVDETFESVHNPPSAAESSPEYLRISTNP